MGSAETDRRSDREAGFFDQIKRLTTSGRPARPAVALVFKPIGEFRVQPYGQRSAVSDRNRRGNGDVLFISAHLVALLITGMGPCETDSGQRTTDRKSTRLNSSH